LEKSELQKALEKRADLKRKQEMESEKLTRRNSLELRLEKQALKLNETSNHLASDPSSELEFIQIRSRLFSSHKSRLLF